MSARAAVLHSARARHHQLLPPWVPVAAWAGLVLAGGLLARSALAADYRVHIGAPPLVGGYDVRLGWGALIAIASALAGVLAGPALAARARWSLLLAGSWAASAGWALALALSDGPSAIARPLGSRYELLTAVPSVGDPLDFVRGFLADLPTYATHVKGHPPGLVLILWAIDAIGLGGTLAAALLLIVVGALAAPAALVLLAELAGRERARAAAPFLVLLPGAVFMATSADAFFTGAALVAIAVLARGAARGSDRLCVLGGVLFAAAACCSYGVAPLGLVAITAMLVLGRPRALLAAALGGALVLGAFALAGFWWLDGVQATRDLALAGVQSRRAYAPFLIVSAAAFALSCGPAVAAGLTRLRGAGRGQALVVGATLVALLAADLSGISRGETERVWLPFAPLLALSCAGLGRGWLAAQAALALVLQLGVLSPW